MMSSSGLRPLITGFAEQLTTAQVAFGHGTTNAFDEAAWLVLWCLGLPLDSDLDIPLKSPLSADQLSELAILFDKRITTRQPAAYLTQEAWLQGVPFYIDARSIVPRSLIAELLMRADENDGDDRADRADDIDPWLHPDTRRVLDLCTGNGSLAVLTAMVFPDVTVDAADLSSDALAVAAINVAKHGLHERITLIESNGLAALTGPYDLIICNPPYVNASSMAALPAEYLAEPSLALAGGADGMDFIRTLITQAPQHMTDDAVLILEIGNERAYFEAAFPTLAVTWLHTSAGADQVLLVTRDALAL